MGKDRSLENTEEIRAIEIAMEAKMCSMEAKNQIQSHKDHCEEIQKAVMTKQIEMSDNIRGIYKLLWRGVIWIVLSLLSLCGTLIGTTVYIGFKYVSLMHQIPVQ